MTAHTSPTPRCGQRNGQHSSNVFGGVFTRWIVALLFLTAGIFFSGCGTSISANGTGTSSLTTPAISWAPPAAITFGTPLSSAQLDATASVPGTFVYSPAAGTVPPVGTDTLSVTFTPTDTSQYNTATASVSLVVNAAQTKTTPTITWADPAAIPYGTPLSSTQLDATASIAGTFTYTPAAGTVPPVGTDTLSVTFTPADTTDYNSATASVQLVVNPAASKTTPAILWATPSPITYGTPLSATQLDATASVAGTFSYSPAAGTVLPVGTQTLTVTFTPSNTSAFNTTTASVKLVVNSAAKITPTIYWPSPAPITSGTSLSANQLDAMASVPGTFVYSPAAGTVLPVGTNTLSVTFTPSDTTTYTTATAAVQLVVQSAAKTTPTITWATPAPITYGTALSSTQLDATASVPGTFVYSPAAGTISPVGTDTLTVTFTPTDTTTYNSASASVSLVVNGAAGVLNQLTCVNASISGSGTDSCTVGLTAAAGSSGLTVSLSSNNSAVAVPSSVTVQPGSSSAGFSATTSAVTSTQTAVLTATAGGVTETYTINLSVPAPALTLQSTSVSFGDVTLKTPNTQTVILTSSGTAPLTISAGTVTGAGFSISGVSFPVTLNQGQTATLAIEFDPTTAGAASGTVTLTDNTAAGTATIALSGTGTSATTSSGNSYAVVPPGACANNGDGTEWSCAASDGAPGAYVGLPSTLTRGDIYYLADGNYGNSLSLSQADSGTSTIELRKAQSYDYGGMSGWNTATMGSAQAVWDWASGNIVHISSDYWIINGNGNNAGTNEVGCGGVQANPPASMTDAPPNPAACGIKIDDSNCTSTATDGCDGGSGVMNGGGHDITWESDEWKGQGLNSAGNNNSETYFWFATGGNLTNVTLSHIYCHNASTTCFTVVSGGWNNGSYDHNYMWGLFDGSVNHGESIQLQGSNGQTTKDVIHHNIFRDQQTNGDVVAVIGGTQTYDFYDNVDYCSSGGTSTSCRHNDGVIGCFNSQTCANVHVYNNTFSFPSDCGFNVSGGASTITLENNIFYGCSSVGMINGSGGTNTVDYNSYLDSNQSAVGSHDISVPSGAPDPLPNLSTGILQLPSENADWDDRLSLGSPYDTADLFGNPFTTDRGAVQYEP